MGRRDRIARVLIDTGALLALANPRDQYHEQAVALAKQFVSAGSQWIGTTLVLAELHGHLLHRRGPTLARTVLGQLLEDPVYEWHDVPVDVVEAAVSAWPARFRDQRFSLTDAVSFEVMRRERLTTAFAFDRDFVTAGFELLA